ncbi:MAG: hypothetical protein H6Q15_173 [Bacteroidetes bacterium]|nr:hypothetical protein [Bacteroidota bacterium]
MEDKKKFKIRGWYIYLIFPLTIGLFFVAWYLFDYTYPSNNLINYQDKFTAISALFSGFAFAGVICTIILQSRELKLQRQELELTRQELKLQREAAEKQNELLERQRFENTFFNLLQNLSSFVESFEFKGYKGTTGFYIIIRDLKGIKGFNSSNNNLLEEFKLYYKDKSNSNENIGLYFRMLYRLIKFVDESDLKDYEKYQYTSFVRAQLSNDQLLLLFLNCALGNGKEKFKKLVEDWVLLKNLPKGAIENMISWIDNKAFERGDRYQKPNKVN